MGYSVDTGRNVYLQPSLASQGVKGTVTNALASAFVGSLGGGKSFCNNLLVYYSVLFGGQAVILDPKSERGNWKETLPEIAHEINIVNLTSDKDNAGLLDPFVIMKNVKDAESLAIDILTFLTGISSRDGEKFPVLRKAVRSVTQSDSRGLLHVIDELRREDTPISRNIADHIDSFTDYDFAHLLFSDGTVENAISLDNQLNIIQVADLVLPDKDTTFEEYTTIELLSVSMLIVISTFALDFIHSDRSIFKIVDLDEAWAFLNVAQGETLYRKKRNDSQHIIDLVDGLEETYYIADVLPKPKEFQNEAYYYALKKACKSMNDKIGKITEEKQDYQEYVESFAHEIKIPIGALSLTFDNTKNYTLKKETDKIFQLVEQMLYYARSENTEKDYFVKQLQLEEVIHNVILKFRHSLMERKAIINIHDIENVVYTDEKWLIFILSQIVQNAIKYFDKQENKLTIYSQDNETNILLVIEDNGCGIKTSDLSRVFEKGFTGSNRNKANATGMGLYLSKKLCDRLGLKLDIASTEKEYTRLTITFPKGTVHNFSE